MGAPLAEVEKAAPIELREVVWGFLDQALDRLAIEESPPQGQ